MNLSLVRTHKTARACTGELSINGAFECFTCEDIPRLVKVPRSTAIPAGTYEVVITFSNRFQKPLPLLMNVPGFEGVRIHPGNTHEDTEGCILVGKTRDAEAGTVSGSRPAFTALLSKLRTAMKTEKVHIAITQQFESQDDSR